MFPKSIYPLTFFGNQFQLITPLGALVKVSLTRIYLNYIRTDVKIRIFPILISHIGQDLGFQAKSGLGILTRSGWLSNLY